MKFLHTSDWHLGMTFRSGVSYADDQKFVIEKICEIAAEEKVDGILIAGDVFDKSIASSEAIRAYDEVMTHICAELEIPVYVIVGNHDGAERLSQCNELLKKSGLFIAGSLTDRPQKIRTGDTDIYLLPWISTDKVKAVYPEKAEEIDSLEDAYRVVLDDYRNTFSEGQKNILVAHAFIVDAETSVSDIAAEVGKATMVGSSVFEGFDYVALGHLHGPQQINEKIRYSGSPMAYSFGREENQVKSVVIFDTGSGEQKVVPIPQLHKRTTLMGTFEELKEADLEDEVRNGYVKLVVTDSYVGLNSVAMFRERYKNLLEVTGKDLEQDDGNIKMTIEDLEKADTDPEAVFMQYCMDMMGEAPGEHWLGLFREALTEYEKGIAGE